MICGLGSLLPGLVVGVLIAFGGVAIAVALLIAIGTGWGCYRLVTRSCRPGEQAVVIRGVWNTYVVQWANLRTIYHSHYVPGYRDFTGALVTVVFDDEFGIRHGVTVSSNRRHRTSEAKARELMSWIPEPWRSSVGLREIVLGPPDEADGEWFRTARHWFARRAGGGLSQRMP